MLSRKGLTLTIVFEAESANYGEGIGNITSLKKMSRGDGNMYSYISRQAMRYSIVKQMGADDTPVHGENGVVQFAPSAKIDEYPEIDLFGYMKTRSKSKENDDAGGADVRSAVVRLSNAIALEPYNSDLDFLTNMGLSSRGDVQGKPILNSIAQSEIQHSLYCYTLTIDLDRVGVDPNSHSEIAPELRAQRVCDLLETIQFLYRDIKGRRENLSPIFAIGGVYARKAPYFEGRCRVVRGRLDVKQLAQLADSCEDTRMNTLAGIVDGAFLNSEEAVKELNASSVSVLFDALRTRVREEYHD